MANNLFNEVSFEPILSEKRVPKETATIALGTVENNADLESGGRLMVICKTFFGNDAEGVEYCAPGAGAGYGMFTPPGKGATVVIAKLPDKQKDGSRYICLGGLYAPFVQTRSARTQPNGLAADDLIKEETSSDTDDTPIVSRGVPDEFETYAGNNKPDHWVYKHPCGHSLLMGRKVTEDINQNEIRLKTAGDKRLLMSDAPHNSGGDCIQLVDENKNSIKIQAEDDANPNSLQIDMGENIHVNTKTGEIEQIISAKSKGDYSVQNHGTGDVNHIAAKGNVNIQAAKTVTLSAGGKAKIVMSDNAIVLSVGGTSLTITDAGVDIV